MSDDAARMAAPDYTVAGKADSKGQSGPLPFHLYPPAPMVPFNPDVHLSQPFRSHAGNSGVPPPLPLGVAARLHPKLLFIPRVEDCHALWDCYSMMDHIRTHSALVADLARALGVRAAERGMHVVPEALLAAGLLHDLGKTYTIAHGGSHAQLGASWVMKETRNGPIAQAVMFHVHWPWDEAWLEDERLCLTAFIIYSDKRVKHDAYVGLDERFEDLLVRYGVDGYARERIAASHQQGKRLEAALSRRLGVELHEYIADSGRLVKRA